MSAANAINTQRVEFIPVSEMDKVNWGDDEKICPICWEELVPIEVDTGAASSLSKIIKNLTYWLNPFSKNAKAKDLTPVGHILTTQGSGNRVPITHSSDNRTPKIGHAVHRECAIKAKILDQFKKCFTCQDEIANGDAFDRITSLKERVESLLGYAGLGALTAGAISYVADLSSDQVAIAALAGYALSLFAVTAYSSMQEKLFRSLIPVGITQLERLHGLPQERLQFVVPILGEMPLSHMIKLAEGLTYIVQGNYPLIAVGVGREIGNAFISGSEPELLEMGTKAGTVLIAMGACIAVISIAAKVSVLVAPLANQLNREHQD